ncbi:myb-binding protein 1A [Ischnura elegans]|uniref:myb-binding protein 1A n=1 Tax=Ischnura elegans TaxID=197161 RepID=UPI001ED8A620|nr:myb-binding protein 1A [Ischnura elegans]
MVEKVNMDQGGTRGNDKFAGKKLENVQTSTLEGLRSLGKPSESNRVQAALSIFRKLVGKPYGVKDDDSQHKNELDYVLERLVRGVAASRNESRTGYFAALSSLLNIFPVIPVKDVIELVKRELSKGKNVSKSEAADIHMGQVLVYGAIIKSGRFIEASEEEQSEILTGLVTAGSKRSYLTLVANNFLSHLIKEANKKLLKKIIWPAIQEITGIKKDPKDRSLDELHLLLCIKSYFPKVISEEDSVLSAENVPHCASVLMNIPNVSYIKHPVYEEYCREVVGTEHALLLWSNVEQHLVKQNRNRQLVGLEVLKHIINHTQDKSQLSAFISPPFINIILKSKANAKQSQDKEMQVIFSKVKEVFDVLMKNLQHESVNDKTKVLVLKKLLFHPGNFMIEKDTGLKIVQPITTSLASKGIKKLAKVYQDVVSGKISIKEEDGNTYRKPDFRALPWKNKERIYAAQLLARLVGVTSMASEHDWKFEQAKFLLHWGVFSKQLGHSDSNEVGVVGLELAHALRESFFRSLDHKCGLNDSIALLFKLVSHVNDLLMDDSVEDKALKGKALEDWEKAMVVIRKLEEQTRKEGAGEAKSRGNVGGAKVFLLLFLHLSLQLFDWDAKLASDCLEELYTCYAKMEQEQQSKVSGTPSKKSKKLKVAAGEDKDAADDAEPEDLAWVEVVVDLFLHLLSQNRHLLRSIVGSVFGHLCPQLTATALHSILQVLDPRPEKSPLGKNDDESDDEENGEEDSQDSDEGSDEKEEDEEDISGDESNDSDDEEEEPTVNETLKLAVQKALGTAAPTSDTESVDVDEIGEEEGQQLDAALSNAFRLLKETKNTGKAKKQQSKDEKMLTHFRVRVIDLLEIYIESTPSMALCCDLVLPLLEALEFCIRDNHQKPLENRLRSLFKKFCHIKSFSTIEGIEDKILCDLLGALLDKGSKTAPIYLEMANEIMHCCTFVVKASEFLRKETEKNVTKKSKKGRKSEVHGSTISDIYKKSLETFFTKRDCLLPVGMFRQALQVQWPGRWSMLPILVQYSFDQDVRPFRRSQALQLLTAFFQNMASLPVFDDSHVEELVSLKKEISSHSKEFLEKVLETNDNSKVGRTFVCLIGLLHAIKSFEQHRQVKGEIKEEEEKLGESNSAQEGMDWSELGVVLTSLFCTPMKQVSFDGKRGLRKLLKSLGLKEVIERHESEKRQKEKEAKVKKENGEAVAADVNESESSDDEKDEVTNTKLFKEDKEKEKREKKKKRKKASKIEARKQKKEAKEFRMQEFSKGLEGSSFVGMDSVPANMEVEEDSAMDNSLNSVEGRSVNKIKRRKSDTPTKKAKKIKTLLND